MTAKEHMIARKEALAFYLAKEVKRHQKDIDRANADLDKLRAQGITIPDPDVDDWIEA